MRYLRHRVLTLLWAATMACFLWKFFPTQDDEQKEKETEKHVLWFIQRNPVMFPYISHGASSERPLWPEDDPDNDRIVDQLMYVPPNYLAGKMDKVKTIAFLGYFDYALGRNEFEHCPVWTCEFIEVTTTNLKTADALMIKGDTQFDDREDHPQEQVWIYYQLESPSNSPEYPKNKDVINWTATYRRDSDLVAPYAKYVPYSAVDKMKNNEEKYRRGQKKNYSLGKEKKVAWFVSNCEQRSGRMAYAKELQKYIQIDTFGLCGRECPEPDNECLDLLDKRYKFYLSFENSICKDYVTEKFFTNALGHNVVPIVFGTTRKEYEKVAPLGSFIHVDDFSSPKVLAEYLHLVDKNDTLYNEYFAWKGKGDFINTFFACRLCALLHSPLRPKSYPDLQEWWARNGTCREEEEAISRPNSSLSLDGYSIIEEYVEMVDNNRLYQP